MTHTNKIVLVTGGSRGLGRNMALRIAEKGNDIIITYNSKKHEALEVVAEIKRLGRKAIALQLNVADTTTFDSFYTEVATALKETFNTDKIDFLVNNAGIGIHASFAELLKNSLML